MKKLSVLAAVAAFALAEVGSAATVVQDADTHTSWAYPRTEQLDVARPVPMLLKGHAVSPGNAYLPQNAPFVVVNTSPIDSSTLRVGSVVPFALPEDFTLNNRVVAAKDTPLVGIVTNLKRRNINSGFCYITIEIKELLLQNNVPVALNCRINMRDKSYVYFPAKSEFIAKVARNTDLGFSLDAK